MLAGAEFSEIKRNMYCEPYSWEWRTLFSVDATTEDLNKFDSYEFCIIIRIFRNETPFDFAL